jgi:hypothetical protein
MEIIKSIFGSEKSVLLVNKRPLECYLLPGMEPVFDRRSFQRVLGYDGRSNRWLYDFLVHLSRNIPISMDLLDAVQENRHFSVESATGDLSLKVAIEPDIALKICRIISQANKDGLLYLSELKHAKAADAILAEFPPEDIYARIRFATGLDRFKMNIREKLVKILTTANPDNIYKWILTLSDDFLEQAFEFYGIGWEDAADHTTELASFLDSFIFSRIDPSSAEKLRNSKPRMAYRKSFATESYRENPLFSQQVQGLWALMRLSNRHLALLTPLAEKAYPSQRSPIDLITKKTPEAGPPESFKSVLIKGITLK